MEQLCVLGGNVLYDAVRHARVAIATITDSTHNNTL